MKAKISAGLWLAVVIICFVFLWQKDFGRSAVETDILELLPPTSRTQVVNAAVKKFAEQISDRAVVLVTAPTFELAQPAAAAYAASLRGSQAFSEVKLEIDAGIEQALKSLYFPHRYALLSRDVRETLKENDAAAKLLDYVEQVIASPVSGGITDFLSDDPLLLFPRFLSELGGSLGRTSVRDGLLVTSRDGAIGIIVVARLKGGAFSHDVQTAAVEALAQAKAQALAASPQALVLASGVVRYAEKSARESQAEVTLIGIGSLVGVVVLMLVAYRAVTPLALMLLTIAIGCAAALAASLLVFTKVHVITLGFGASLIGVGVDHGFHFFSFQAFGPQRSRFEVLRAIFPGIFLGILTTILGFLGLLIAPFPGLNQMAFFSIVGLTAAFLTVVLWYPFLSRVRRGNPDNATFRLIRKWLGLWSSGSPMLTVVTFLALAVTAIGILRAHVDDDVRLLENRDPVLKSEDDTVGKFIGGTDTSRFFVVSGVSPEEVLQREELLTAALAQTTQAAAGYQALSQFIPSETRQLENLELVKIFLRKNTAVLREKLTEMGFEDATIADLLDRAESRETPLTFDAWRASPASEPVQHLWLGSVSGVFLSLVTLADGANVTAFQGPPRIPGTYFVDRVRDTSSILAEHRLRATGTIFLFYLLVLVVLIHRYGIRSGFAAFFPAVLAGAVCIAGCGLSGQPVNLFSILAILIVLGLGIDFAVFLLEGEHEIEATMFAVVLSALSTLLSLALLALCSAPVLRSFGQSMFLGTATAMFFAPVVLYRRPNDNGDA